LNTTEADVADTADAAMVDDGLNEDHSGGVVIVVGGGCVGAVSSHRFYRLEVYGGRYAVVSLFKAKNRLI
jgi:hypothetical protein